MMRWLTLACSLIVCTGALSAQGNDKTLSVGLRLADEVRIGRPAPGMILPYATRDSIGPANQPFDLSKELGRVVVLAFYPGDFTPGCEAEWRSFALQADSLFGSGVVVAGISADSLATHVRFARALDLPFKLLSDPDKRVSRVWGATNGDRMRRMVVVVGRDGIVQHVDNAFGALDPASYAKLATAVRGVRAERP
jgi:peroxiredoxin Q/BCP